MSSASLGDRSSQDRGRSGHVSEAEDGHRAEALNRQSHGSRHCYQQLEKPPGASFLGGRRVWPALPPLTPPCTQLSALLPGRHQAARGSPAPSPGSPAVRNWAELSSPALLASPWPFPGPAWGCQDPQQVPGETGGWRGGLGAAGRRGPRTGLRETLSKILFLILPRPHLSLLLLIIIAAVHWAFVVCLTVFDHVCALTP